MKKHLFIFFALICSLDAFTQTVPAYVPANGLVGWYSFTGNANDESGFGNNGIVNGATLTAGKLAIPNSAYLFNGTSNVINLLNPFLGGTQVNAFSFHALIKLNSLVNSSNIWGKTLNWGESNLQIYNNGSVNFTWANTVSGNKYSSIYSQANIIQTGIWYDIVVVFQNSSGQIYLNGNPIVTNLQWMAQGGSILSTSQIEAQCNFAQDGNTSKIGQRISSGSPTDYFNGIIDEFGVWDRALTACEIKKLSNADAGLTIVGSANTICSGQSINLTASGATNYLWSTGATSSSITINPNINTTYSVTTTYSANCVETKTVSVTVNQTPTVAVNSATICSGTNANIIASGATSYSWDNGATTSSISVSPNANTNYTVTGLTNGCSDTKTLSVTVNQTPTVAVNSATICSGTNATIIASGATSYSWDSGATTNSISVSPNSNTNYTVTGLTNGCSDTKTLSVTVNQTPTVAVNSTTICSGTNASIIASGATSYSWDSGATTNSISVSPNSNTNYTVTGLTNGCSDTKTVSVTVNQTPTVAVNSATICSGNSFTINPYGAATYSYSNGSPIVSPLNTSTYTVTGSSIENCVSVPQTLTVTVEANAIITSQPTNQTLLTGSTAIFTITTTSNSILQWQTNLGVGFQNLSNISQYSGVNTATLTVSNLSISNDNQIFRCIAGTGLCSDTSDVATLFLSPVSVEELRLLQNITIYPNPATSQVTIIADAKLSGTVFTVYNYIGKSVIEGKINAENTVIDLENLSEGIYLINIGENIKQTFKVIKQ